MIVSLGVTSRKTVEGAGSTLAVSEHGDPSDPTVVLVHGYPDSSSVWDLVAARLAGPDGDGHHVVTYDVRGAGDSSVPEATLDYRLELLVADLAAVIDAVSPDRPVHLVGHDWGSIQSWEAILTPGTAERVASFTSVSGPPLDHAGMWLRARRRDRAVRPLASQALRSSYIPAMHLPGSLAAARRLRRPLRRFRTRWVRSLDRDARVDERWPAETFADDLANGMRLYRANVRPRLRAPVQRHSSVPVQLVVATRDPFVPPRLLEGLEHWSSTVVHSPIDAAHWVPRSHPEELAELIVSFVAAHG